MVIREVVSGPDCCVRSVGVAEAGKVLASPIQGFGCYSHSVTVEISVSLPHVHVVRLWPQLSRGRPGFRTSMRVLEP